jgi:hypothetical protein
LSIAAHALQRVPLPELPAHAKYVHHQNECYDWGTYGWLLLRSGMVDISAYKFFFFVNSSVRGPYLPAYARVSTHRLYGHGSTAAAMRAVLKRKQCSYR